MKLTKKQYKEIAQILPIQRGNVAISNLDVINALIYLIETGCKWRELPSKYGKWNSIYKRVTRWAREGLLTQIIDILKSNGVITSDISTFELYDNPAEKVVDTNSETKIVDTSGFSLIFIGNKYLGDSDRALRAYLSRKFESYNLGYNKFIFFVAIYRHPGASQTDICRITLFDKAVVARAIAKMEESGLVYREYFDNDKKTSHLYLTPKGIAVAAEVMQIVRDLNKKMYDALDMQPESLELILYKISVFARQLVQDEFGTDAL